MTARPAMQSTVLDPWPKDADGNLDLDRAPLRLLAIVNRIDLRNLSAGSAGEVRFVYGVLDSAGNPLAFTVIVEYGIDATTEADVLGWASAWHALGALPFPSEPYNAALEALTRRFSGRGAAPSRANGSGCHGLETNTNFTQISPREAGFPTMLSGFLTGTTAVDPVTGAQRTLNDLARRNQDLANLTCTPASGTTTSGVTGTSIAVGLRRTH